MVISFCKINWFGLVRYEQCTYSKGIVLLALGTGVLLQYKISFSNIFIKKAILIYYLTLTSKKLQRNRSDALYSWWRSAVLPLGDCLSVNSTMFCHKLLTVTTLFGIATLPFLAVKCLTHLYNEQNTCLKSNYTHQQFFSPNQHQGLPPERKVNHETLFCDHKFRIIRVITNVYTDSFVCSIYKWSCLPK